MPTGEKILILGCAFWGRWKKKAIILTSKARIGPMMEKSEKNYYVEKIMVFGVRFLTVKNICRNKATILF